MLASLETLVIAMAGGGALALAGVPAGLVTGSVLAVALAALAGRPMRVPTVLAQICSVLVGILLGAIVTPDTLQGVTTWPFSIALLSVATIAMIAATTSYLRLVHRWDWPSAFLGGSPGAMAQVISLAAEFKADLRGVAILHVMRVLIIMIGLPGGLVLFGLMPETVIGLRDPPGGSSLLELVILIGASAALAWFLRFIKFPGGLLFGSMAASAILHGTGWVHAVLPWWVAAFAVTMMGAIAGSRFANTSWRTLVDYLGAAVGSFAVALAVTAGFAAAVIAWLPFRPADVIIAFAPGAQDQMMLLALALMLDPVYVGAHHLARWLICTFALAVFGQSLTYARGPDAVPPKQWRRPGQGMSDD